MKHKRAGLFAGNKDSLHEEERGQGLGESMLQYPHGRATHKKCGEKGMEGGGM